MSNLRRCRVTTEHNPPSFTPATFPRSETFSISKRDHEWPAFLWCVHVDGGSAWIPEEYLEMDGEKARLLIDYDSTELDANVGETLTIIKSAGGWYWCRNQNGNLGWIPINKVQPVE